MYSGVYPGTQGGIYTGCTYHHGTQGAYTTGRLSGASFTDINPRRGSREPLLTVIPALGGSREPPYWVIPALGGSREPLFSCYSRSGRLSGASLLLLFPLWEALGSLFVFNVLRSGCRRVRHREAVPRPPPLPVSLLASSSVSRVLHIYQLF